MPADQARHVLGRALQDAIDYRLPETNGCRDCTDEALCVDHAADQMLAAEYADLADHLAATPEAFFP